jgi:hypothetical protein
MKQAGRSLGRWRTTETFPSVETDVMVIASGRKKRRPAPPLLSEVEGQDATVEIQRAFEVGHFEVNMANANAAIDRVAIHTHLYVTSAEREGRS